MILAAKNNDNSHPLRGGFRLTPAGGVAVVRRLHFVLCRTDDGVFAPGDTFLRCQICLRASSGCCPASDSLCGFPQGSWRVCWAECRRSGLFSGEQMRLREKPAL